MRRTYFLIAFTVFLFGSATFAAGSTYYVAANGSDSNNGTSKSTAWLHAPGMTGCSSLCSAANINPGDSVILRGGDTWHFSGRGTPVGLPWRWPQFGGTSGSPVYIGVDVTWFTGGSWTRPVFTGDNPPNTSNIAGCAHSDDGLTYFVHGFQLQYVTFDNFEFTGMCWDAAASPSNFPGYTANNLSTNLTWSNLYFHGWTHTTNCTGSGCSTGPAAMAGDSHSNGGQGNQFVRIVCDGSDTSKDAMACILWDAYDIHDSVIRQMAQGVVANNCHILHTTLFEYIYEAPVSTGDHSNVWECNSEWAGNNIAYNNVVRHTQTAVTMWINPNRTDYIYNNVMYDILSEIWAWDNSSGGSAIFYNNIFADTDTICPQPRNGTLFNNLFINSNSSCSGWTNNSSFSMTDAQAAVAGFTSSNLYQPTSSTCNGQSSPTCPIGNGSNQTSSCVAAGVALCSDTTNACTYQSTTHSVSCPARSALPRPSGGNWDGGAYRYGTISQPNPPTNLTATPH